MKRKIVLTALLLTVCCLFSMTVSSCGGKKYDVVMEYRGITLTEDMYQYWMSTFKRNILSYYADARDTAAFWDDPYDDTRTVEAYFTDLMNDRIMAYLVAQDLYKRNRLTLDDDAKKKIRDDIDEKIEYYGSRRLLNQELSSIMLNVDTLQTIYTWEEKYNCVYQYLFGKGGIMELTDEDLTAYYERMYSNIRYIVIYTTGLETDENGAYRYDENGNLISRELTEEELAEKRSLAAACERSLLDGADFDEMEAYYSEFDTSAYPNGFFVSANELSVWGAEIVVAAKKASVGEIFRVEEESAIFLIKKQALPSLGSLTEEDISQLSDLANNAAREISDAFFRSLSEEIIVNRAVMDRYPLAKIKPNPFFNM